MNIISYPPFRQTSLFIILLALSCTLSTATVWGEEKIEVIKRTLLADDLPSIRVEQKEHDHSKHKKRAPVLLPGPEGKFQIGERKGDAVEGETLYKKSCVYCHGKQGLGDGITVIGLRVKPKSFIRKEGILHMQDQAIFDIITYGVKSNYQLDMPAWGPNLSVEERLNVLAYVKELAQKMNSEAGEKSSDEKHTDHGHNGSHKH